MPVYYNSIQQGSITIADGVTSGSLTLGLSVGTLAFMLFQGQNASDSGTAAKNHMAVLTLTQQTGGGGGGGSGGGGGKGAGSTVTASRGGTLGTLTVNFVVVDATASLVASVQSGTIAIASTANTNTATIAGVDLTHAAVFLTGQETTSSSPAVGNWLNSVSLTDAATVTATNEGGACTVGYAVVQFAAGVINSLEQMSVATNDTVLAESFTIASVVAANALIAFGGFSMSTTANYNAAMEYLSHSTAPDITTVTANRQAGSHGNRITNCTIVEFIPGILNASSGIIALGSGTSAMAAIAADPTASFINYLGESSNLATYQGNEGHAAITLTNATTVTATVAAAGAQAVIAYQLVIFGGTQGGGGTGSPGYPVYPPGWPGTLTSVYWGWQNNSGLSNLKAAVESPNFCIVDVIHLVLLPDDIVAGSSPQLNTMLSLLPPGKAYWFYINTPLSSLSQPSYSFAVRTMNVRYAGRNAQVMKVPILSAANGPLVTAWVEAMLYDLIAIFAAATAAAPPGTSYVLKMIGCGITSEINFDSEMTIPSDAGNGVTPPETPAQAIANWEALGVTESVVTTVLANHVTAIAQGPGLGRILLCDFLNPDLSLIGQQGDGGASYTTNTSAMSDALMAVGAFFTVFDASLTNNTERTLISNAANYAGSYACQVTGGAPFVAAMQYAKSRSALWIDIPTTYVDWAVGTGWNGSEFVTTEPPSPDVFVTA